MVNLPTIVLLDCQFNFTQVEKVFSAHEDPYDVHQIVVPIMAMSKKGDDFHGGGNFVRTSENSVIDTEDLVSPGDIVLFNSLCEHGVALVDEDLDFDPLAKSGRWMMLFAVNKTANNKQIKDAVLKNMQNHLS